MNLFYQHIKRANEKYNNKYTYNIVDKEYKDIQSFVEIVCPIHDSFTCQMSSHIRGTDCKECRNDKRDKLQGDLFKKNSRIVHNNFYTYDKVVYRNNSTEVIITCPEHGDFLQTPRNHYNKKRGCPKCKGGVRANIEVIEQKIKDQYGDFYKVLNLKKYKNEMTILRIECPKHGVFKRPTKKFIRGIGCSDCRIEKEWKKKEEEGIKISTKIHNNKYDYSLLKYKGHAVPVVIICPEHKEFTQPLGVHMKGHGCSRCSAELLNMGYNERDHFIPYLKSLLTNTEIETQYPIPHESGNYFVDAYLPQENLVIEYDEDFHHKQKTSDRERQSYIESKLNCTFIRVPDKLFMENHSYLDSVLGVSKRQNSEELFV